MVVCLVSGRSRVRIPSPALSAYTRHRAESVGAAEVFTFVGGHLAVQEQLDENPDRQLAEWIALITADIGAA